MKFIILYRRFIIVESSRRAKHILLRRLQFELLINR